MVHKISRTLGKDRQVAKSSVTENSRKNQFGKDTEENKLPIRPSIQGDKLGSKQSRKQQVEGSK